MFVGGAITDTVVVSKEKDQLGQDVTERIATFAHGNVKTRERCTHYPPIKVELWRHDGSKVQNIISEGAQGELYMTYVFDLIHFGKGPEESEAQKPKDLNMARVAVGKTLEVMREMVRDGMGRSSDARTTVRPRQVEDRDGLDCSLLDRSLV